MSIIDKVTKQTAVYWQYKGIDEYGKRTYYNPIEILCRWSDTVEKLEDEKGELFYAKSHAIVKIDMGLNDMLYLGSLIDIDAFDTSPLEIEKARVVRRFVKLPNRKVTWYYREAFLE